MKKISAIFEILLFYLIGILIFNIFFSITEIFIARILSLNLNFLKIFISNFYSNLILYTNIYFILIICMYFANLSMVKTLNKKLKRRKTNEK